MSNFGLNVYKENGSILLDNTDKIARNVYSAFAANGSNYSVNIIALNTSFKSIEFNFPLVANFSGAAHTIIRTGTNLLYETWTGTYIVAVSSAIFSFLYT